MLDHGEEGFLGAGSGFFRVEVLLLHGLVSRLNLQIH